MIRLDKFLSKSGFGSRKDVKKLIRNREVFVNGELIVDDDFKVSEEDEIIIGDIVLNYQENIYIMLNKPQGYISANSDDYHATVMDIIGSVGDDVFCVGRLDIDTTGLCLITNDGKLSHRLLSNKKHVEKEYIADIAKPLSLDDIRKLENGIVIDHDEQCLPCKVEVLDELKIKIIITEGKYHQVKRMLKAVDNEVLSLHRRRIKNLVLDEDLALGEFRDLTLEEIDGLKKD